MTRRRLDSELVRRGLVDSRERAQVLIDAGRVLVAGLAATKPARQVDADTPIRIQPSSEREWASRGAYKLLSALDVFNERGLAGVQGRRCLDAGASTGGFTDVLLAQGAAEVIAVDVGYGQLIWRLRSDQRVHVLDRTNIRYLEATDLPYAPDLVVADLSFISLRVVLPALSRVADPTADLLLMVKPQFEVGKELLGKGGVVRSPELRTKAIREVLATAASLHWSAQAVAASGLPGPQGNVEYFVWLRQGAGAVTDDDIVAAVRGGPQ